MTEKELWDTMFGKICESKDAHYAAPIGSTDRPPIYNAEAYAELAKDLVVPRLGLDWKAGTPVRIVMCSRLGDLGVTRDLNAQHGYNIRVQPGDGYLTNIRFTKKPA